MQRKETRKFAKSQNSVPFQLASNGRSRFYTSALEHVGRGRRALSYLALVAEDRCRIRLTVAFELRQKARSWSHPFNVWKLAKVHKNHSCQPKMSVKASDVTLSIKFVFSWLTSLCGFIVILIAFTLSKRRYHFQFTVIKMHINGIFFQISMI